MQFDMEKLMLFSSKTTYLENKMEVKKPSLKNIGRATRLQSLNEQWLKSQKC